MTYSGILNTVDPLASVSNLYIEIDEVCVMGHCLPYDN